MKRMFQHLILCSVLCLAAGCGGDTKTTDDRRFLLLNISEKLLDNAAGSFDIYITSANVEWRATTEDSWLHPETTSGSGNRTVTISYDKSNVSSRTGTVSFSADGVKTAELKVTQTERTFTNPFVRSWPDPWIVKQGGFYYLCKTVSGGIGVSRSDKLTVPSASKRVFSAPTASGAWNLTNYWAPEMHYVDGRWYIYYAAGTGPSGQNYNKQRTGVLRAKTNDPEGSWEDMGMLFTGDNWSEGITPTMDNTRYAIDMGVFQFEEGGQLYAVWSGVQGTGAGNDRLYIATMKNPYTINSSRVQLATNDQPWEKWNSNVMEGPAFLHNKEKGLFFLVYSTNQSTTKYYCLGWLKLDLNNPDPAKRDPMNPASWTKSSNYVFYRNDDTVDPTLGVNGTGHCCFTKSPDDTEDWIVYHAKDFNASGWGGRSAYIKKFTWNDDGTPNFGTPVGWGEKIAVPSGEPQ